MTSLLLKSALLMREHAAESSISASGSCAPAILTLRSQRLRRRVAPWFPRGGFAPGLPYAFVKDPDGYEIEWGGATT
jgi:hypothetical protein